MSIATLNNDNQCDMNVNMMSMLRVDSLSKGSIDVHMVQEESRDWHSIVVEICTMHVMNNRPCVG
jgi:hypothetical protein